MENNTYQRLTALPLPDRAKIKSNVGGNGYIQLHLKGLRLLLL